MMNHSFDSHERPQVSRTSKFILAPLLTLVSSTTSAELVRSLFALGQVEVQNFDLGDKILNFQGSTTAEANPPMLYLVCRGAVRLLFTEPRRDRKLTVDLLQPGASFGLDSVFCPNPFAYEAIAATPCQVICIPFQQLVILLEQIPQLKIEITQQVQRREQLIFFRSLPSFRAMSSRQLKYMLLPQLIEQRVVAGTSLKQIMPEQSGWFWLRSGEVTSSEETAPVVGDSWGWLGRTPTDWIAQTDLVLYEIPLERLEAVRLMSFL